MTSTSHNDIEAIVSGLAGSYSILSGFVNSIPDEILHCKRGEGFWSIAEHVAHLAQVQIMGLERINRILNEDKPEFIPYFPEEDKSITPRPTMDQCLIDFKTSRNAIVNRLAALKPEDWERLAFHPEYREYGLHIFARHILMHDHWHMYRMEELWLTRDDYLTRLEG